MHGWAKILFEPITSKSTCSTSSPQSGYLDSVQSYGSLITYNLLKSHEF